MAISVPSNKGTQLPPMQWAGQVDELAGKQDWRQAIMWEVCDRATRPIKFHALAKLKGLDEASARDIAGDVEEMLTMVIDAACCTAEGLRHVGAVPERVSDVDVEKLICRVFADGFGRLHWGPKGLHETYYSAVIDRSEAAKYQGMNRRLESVIHRDMEA